MSKETLEELQKRVEILSEKVEMLEKKSNRKVIKKDSLKIGDEFDLAGLRWKILDIVDGQYKCLGDFLEKEMKFDDESNDWKKSDLRNFLNQEFYEKLVTAVGKENIIPFERDLLSLDGQTEYGSCEDYVSLISLDDYRKYRNLIPNTNDWWWMITPWSTKCNGYEKTVTVVSPAGYVGRGSCDYDYGVRPFVSLSSAIFESEEE